MLPIRTILHPTDFSDSARPAFELACALARDYGATLILVHVVPSSHALAPDAGAVPLPFEEPYGAHARLARLRPDDPRVAVEHHVVEGDPADHILKAAADRGVDLIVMGTHGTSGLKRLLVGSVAESV